MGGGGSWVREGFRWNPLLLWLLAILIHPWGSLTWKEDVAYRGRTQVKERSTHARPGMHMQQCSAVLTAVVTVQLSSVGSLFEIGRVFSAKTADLHSFNYITLFATIQPLHRAGTQSARPSWVTVRWVWEDFHRGGRRW